MLGLIIRMEALFRDAVRKGVSLQELVKLPVLERIIRMKMVDEGELSRFQEYEQDLINQVNALAKAVHA